MTPDTNPNEAMQEINTGPVGTPVSTPGNINGTPPPAAIQPSYPTVTIQPPNNSVGPGNMPPTPYMGSVAGTVPTPQAQTTPQTPTVSQIMSSLGTGASQYGSQSATPGSQYSQIAQTYTALAASNAGTQAPATNPLQSPEVQSQLAGGTQPSDSQQEYFDAYSGMNPVTQSLYNNITQMMSTQQTQQSLAQEYQTLAGPNSTLSQDQLQLMNVQTVMNGTQDDVSAEITAAGGTATQSQVMAVTAARNNVIMKQASFLQNQLSVQQSYVNNVLQFSQADESQVNSEISQQTGLLGTMSTLQQTMMQNQIDMANNIVKNGGGYTTLANSLMAADPTGTQLQYYSQLLGADLSSPAWLQQADEYNASKISLEQAKATTALYDNTLMGAGASTGTGSGTYGTATTSIAQTTGLNPNTPLSQVDPTALLPGIIQNEGGSLPGVQNNPGNIKFAGLPGQTDSGVAAADGGTFANYATTQDGQAAVLQDIQAGVNNNPNQTLGQFIDSYTNTAPKQLAVGTTGSPSIDSTAPGYSTKPVVGGMTQAAIDQAAVIYATSGTLPAGARSSTGAGLAMSSAVKNRAAEMDLTGNISANKAQLTALSSSLTTQTTYLNTTQRALTSADNSFNQILSQFQNSGINDQSMPIENILENQAKYGLGTSQISAFKASLADLSTEYQQVFSRGGGQVTDAVRATSQDIIDGNISLANLKQVNEQLQKQGAIAVASAQQQVNSINGQISSIATGGAQGITKGSLSDTDFVNQVLSANNVSYQSAVNSVPSGQIGVINNSTGQFGAIDPSEMDPSLYTEI